MSDSTILDRNRLVPIMFSTPAIAVVGLVLAFPVLYSVYESFFATERLGAPKQFVGLGNYGEVLSDGGFWSALGRSMVFITGSIILGQFLAIVFAFSLYRLVKRLRWLRALTILPYIVSSVAAAVMFRIVFNREFGPPNQLIEFLGGTGLPWLVKPWLAMAVVIIAQVWSDLPLSILVILGGLQTIESSYLDAALVDGATGWTRARYVSLPLIAPQLLLSTIWLSYTCLTSLSIILALTGGGPGTATQTLPMEMYLTAFRRLDMPQAMAISNIILLLNGLLTMLYFLVGRRYGSEVER